MKMTSNNIYYKLKKRAIMKKLFIAALIVLAAGSTAFAADVAKVSRQMKNNFEILFPRASNVAWTESSQFLSATFTVDDEELTAFFAKDGDLLGTTQKLELSQLPAKGLKKIRKDYASFKITQAIEYVSGEQSKYYVMIEDENNSKKVLEVDAYGGVYVFKGK
jgi:opacity protein-like surface antigen